MKNLNYTKTGKSSPWRKISLGSWRPTGDSSTYSWDDLDISLLELFAQKRGYNVHSLIVKALCYTVAQHPEINRTVRFGKIHQRAEASVFFHVLPEEGDDLSGVVFNQAHMRPPAELNNDFLQKVKLAKSGNAPLESSKRLFRFVPGAFSRLVLDAMSFVNYTLNLPFGAPKDAFGSVMLTSVGSLGIPRALTPIAPYTRNSMVVSMGSARDGVTVRKGEVSITRFMTFGFVFDHRLMEGKGFASFLRTFREHLEDPENSELFRS